MSRIEIDLEKAECEMRRWRRRAVTAEQEGVAMERDRDELLERLNTHSCTSTSESELHAELANTGVRIGAIGEERETIRNELRDEFEKRTLAEENLERAQHHIVLIEEDKELLGRRYADTRSQLEEARERLSRGEQQAARRVAEVVVELNDARAMLKFEQEQQIPKLREQIVNLTVKLDAAFRERDRAWLDAEEARIKRDETRETLSKRLQQAIQHIDDLTAALTEEGVANSTKLDNLKERLRKYPRGETDLPGPDTDPVGPDTLVTVGGAWVQPEGPCIHPQDGIHRGDCIDPPTCSMCGADFVWWVTTKTVPLGAEVGRKYLRDKSANPPPGEASEPPEWADEPYYVSEADGSMCRLNSDGSVTTFDESEVADLLNRLSPASEPPTCARCERPLDISEEGNPEPCTSTGCCDDPPAGSIHHPRPKGLDHLEAGTMCVNLGTGITWLAPELTCAGREDGLHVYADSRHGPPHCAVCREPFTEEQPPDDVRCYCGADKEGHPAGHPQWCVQRGIETEGR